MKIDLMTFLSSIGVSTVIVSSLGYIFKKIFDETIRTRLQEYGERNKLSIQEAVRREAFIFDEQYQTLKEGLMLVYRSRNMARDLLDLIRKENVNKLATVKLEREFEEMSSFSYSAKTVCPESIFHITHQYKNALRTFCLTVQKYISDIKNEANDDIDQLSGLSDLKKIYTKMNELYESLSEEIHNHLGID